MRNPPAAEIFNEEVANVIKRKIKQANSRVLLEKARDRGGGPTRRSRGCKSRPCSRFISGADLLLL